MISEREIAANCNSRTFARAERIAASDRNILTKRVRYEVGETVLSAQVASSSGWDDHYRASVYLSPLTRKRSRTGRTCPAVVEYDGLCKHCAALALSFSRAPEKFMGYTPKRRVATSACITELMRRGEQFADDSDMEGSIDLECMLTYGYRLWSASFKVASPTSSYVMKSISDFVSRMRAGERYSYGKKLAFTHNPALLTERGRRVAEFLDRAVSLRERSAQATRWVSPRRPMLCEASNPSPEVEVVELLDALDGVRSPFAAPISARARSPRRASFTQTPRSRCRSRNPPRTVTASSAAPTSCLPRRAVACTCGWATSCTAARQSLLAVPTSCAWSTKAPMRACSFRRRTCRCSAPPCVKQVEEALHGRAA